MLFWGMQKNLFAQYVYTINADSVKITNHCDTAELIIENHTQNVPGFLFNKGRGRTEFRKALQKIDDSTYLIGADTLTIQPAVTAANGLSKVGNTIRLGQDFGTPGSPAGLINYTEIPLNGAGIFFTEGIDTVGDGGQIHFRTLNGTYWDDVNGNTVANFTPTTNFITDGDSAQNITNFSISGYYNYSNPNSSGLVTDFTAASRFSPGAGSVSNISYLASPAFITTGGTGDCIAFMSASHVSTSGPSGNLRGFYHNPSISVLGGKNIAFENVTGDVYLNSNTIAAGGGRTGIQGITSPTAYLHIGASDGNANNAPLKLTPGTVLTTPEDGAIEYDGADLYVTQSMVRYKLSKTLTGQLTTNFGGPSLTAFNSVTTSLTVTGAQPGDVVSVSANSSAVNPPSIIITAYITSANTVTLQAYNASNSSITLASDTYKVRVTR